MTATALYDYEAAEEGELSAFFWAPTPTHRR